MQSIFLLFRWNAVANFFGCKKLIFRLFYRIQVVLLAVFKSELLFHRLLALPWYRDTLRLWADTAAGDGPKKVLELGCATGLLAEYLASRKHIVTGVDASPAMIETARAHSNGQVEYRCADATRLPFKDETFDIVLCASLFNIIPVREQLAHEMARVCKRGGTVSVLTPASGFSRQQMHTLMRKRNLKRFSAAALETWYRRAPKMSGNDIDMYLREQNLSASKIEYALEGMVVMVSATKP